MLETETTSEGAAVRPATLNGTGWAPDFAAIEPAFRMLAEKRSCTIRRFLPGPADVEAAIQQTFLKALTNLHQFRGESSLDTWLTRIAINEALLHLRRTRSTTLVPYEEQNAPRTGVAMHWPQQFMPNPEESFFQKEISDLIDKAIASLSPVCRQALLMSYADGLSSPEIARQLRLPVGTTKSRLFRARSDLLHMPGKSIRNGPVNWEKGKASRCQEARHFGTAFSSGRPGAKIGLQKVD